MRRTQSFRAEPASVRAARQFAAQTLADLSQEALEPIALMVSELATNSVQHARTTFELAIVRSEDEIRVEVGDDAPGSPEMRSPAPDEPTGRGLQIVDLLSDDWGVEPREGKGKTVWLTVSTGRTLARQT